MAGRLSRCLGQPFKARLYSTQTAAAFAPKVEKRSAAELAKDREVQVDTSNKSVTVASFNRDQGYQNIVFGFKAGSKYEDPTTVGMSHVLRHTLQLSTMSSSWLELVDALENCGASLRFTSSRDNFYCVLSGLTNVLNPSLCLMVNEYINRKNFDNKEFAEYGGLDMCIQRDLKSLQQEPEKKLVELLHGAAFYGGLGNSLYISPNNAGNIQSKDILAWTKKYCSGSMVLTGSGIPMASLQAIRSVLPRGDNSYSYKYVPLDELADIKGLNTGSLPVTDCVPLDALESGAPATAVPMVAVSALRTQDKVPLSCLEGICAVPADVVKSSASGTELAVSGEPKPVYWGTCNLEPIVNAGSAYFGLAVQADSAGSQGALCAGVMQHALGVGPYIKYMDSPASGRLAALGKYGQVSAYSANYSQTGLFGFLAKCEPKNLSSLVNGARDELTKALTDGLTQEEFNAAKARYLSTLSFQAEDTLGEAIRITDALLAGQKKPTSPIADLEKITLQDVNAWGKTTAGKLGKAAVAGTGNLSDVGALNLVK